MAKPELPDTAGTLLSDEETRKTSVCPRGAKKSTLIQEVRS
jgi:hypothetical protein